MSAIEATEVIPPISDGKMLNVNTLMRVFCSLSHEIREELLETLYKDGPQSVPELRRLQPNGMGDSTFSYHLSRMRKDGLVKKRGNEKNGICVIERSIFSNLEPTLQQHFSGFHHGKAGKEVRILERDEFLRIVSALANPLRYEIARILSANNGKEREVKNFGLMADIPADHISKALALLRGYGIVRTQIKGTNTRMNRVNPPLITSFIDTIGQIFPQES